MVSDHARRDHLIAQVSAGAMTPLIAEAEAHRLGLMPLEYKPDPRDFDPLQERFWTLPMAAAWIAYRTAEAVTENWYAYLAGCRYWIPAGQPGAAGRSGFELVSSHLNSISRMELSEERQQPKARNALMSVSEAKHALWQAVRNSALEVSGVELTTGKRELIDALRLQDLSLGEYNHQDVFRTRALIGIGPVRYHDLTVPMAGIQKIWKADGVGSSVPNPMRRRSGAPGRPSSMDLIKAKHRSRCEDGAAMEGISEEADFLNGWLKVSYPGEPLPSAKTIRNKLASAHRTYISARN